jgi:hypothetical protein
MCVSGGGCDGDCGGDCGGDDSYMCVSGFIHVCEWFHTCV